MTWTKPIELISAERLDVFARTDFARRRIAGQSDSWSRSLYREWLLTSGTGKEMEDGTKISVQDYFRSFESVIDSIEANGFDARLGAIPVRNGVLANGAHRFAVSLVTNQQILIAETNEPTGIYDYRSMKKLGLSPVFIDAMAMSLIQATAKVRGIIIFGEAKSVVDQIEKEIRKTAGIIIRKRIGLTAIGRRRIVEIAYGHNDWWDQTELLEKMTAERFHDCPSHCDVIFTLESDVNSLQDRKERLRTLLPDQTFERKLHGSDFYFDSVYLAECVLNANSLLFLNFAPIGSECRILEMLGGPNPQFRPWSTEQDWCIDGSSVLELFGLRQANDIDFLSVEGSKVPENIQKLGNNHSEAYSRGQINPFEIINDPRNHLIYKGLKFISPSALLLNKFGENDPKSVSDVQLIVSTNAGDRGLYGSLDLQVIGLLSRWGYRFISLTDQALRCLPRKIEMPIRSFVARLRRY